MVVADLHVHTTRSDGTLTLDSVPAAARQAGVEVVAVTDHDRLQPALDGPVTERDGVTLLHGIELRVESEIQRLDLLGYGVDPTDELRVECARIQRNRRERGARIIECVEDRLGVSLPVEPRDGLGRPHIASAIAEVSDHTFQSAFDDLIGDDCPCYVAREVPSFERGCALLSDACGLVGLAHPFRYRDTAAALSTCASLDAVERWYPYGRAVDNGLVDDAIERHGLIPTGGSDAHGETLGDTGLGAAAWDRVETALGV
ncbi:histidinol-phosphatase [Haloarcula taiwanensis]|uniref:Histidinol-phosphatase n=1 Tax=Haloarcula taiwanensis TaxID=1932004 RepID=A0A2H4ZUK1_9EURY|nr:MULTISPECIES: PHP domain-containing protein [Haloarcula]AUG46147.1 histidinol-phosphatase [Haloarcula taiwanensis]RLM40279.1 PHP domain-containing protein [Haloarcula sp. Atlit-120R]RLM48308.1 PHP domain-containing protein [Haloarcula sp. Atlit-47R]